MRTRVKTAPLKEPISIGEFKAFGRIDGTAEDVYLAMLLKGVRDAVEQFLGRALIEQTIVAAMDFWPNEAIVLPRPPLVSITQVRTIDEDDTATEFASTGYYIIKNDFRPRLVIREGTTPPQNYTRGFQGYEIEYLAGYGSTASYVPEMIRMGIMQWAIVGYENRIVPSEPPTDAMKLLERYKVPRI
jgi:uncharacterized phiE125 gp8 family phage protein